MITLTDEAEHDTRRPKKEARTEMESTEKAIGLPEKAELLHY
jgi:hypothetical protein